VTDNHKQWHVDKNISVGHLVTTAALVISGAWWFVTNENRMSELETSAKYNERRLTQVEQTQISQAEWIASKLEQIRLEQREDIVRLTETLQDGFIRLESKLDSKADK